MLQPRGIDTCMLFRMRSGPCNRAITRAGIVTGNKRKENEKQEAPGFHGTGRDWIMEVVIQLKKRKRIYVKAPRIGEEMQKISKKLCRYVSIIHICV